MELDMYSLIFVIIMIALGVLVGIIAGAKSKRDKKLIDVFLWAVIYGMIITLIKMSLDYFTNVKIQIENADVFLYSVCISIITYLLFEIFKHIYDKFRKHDVIKKTKENMEEE